MCLSRTDCKSVDKSSVSGLLVSNTQLFSQQPAESARKASAVLFTQPEECPRNPPTIHEPPRGDLLSHFSPFSLPHAPPSLTFPRPPPPPPVPTETLHAGQHPNQPSQPYLGRTTGTSSGDRNSGLGDSWWHWPEASQTTEDANQYQQEERICAACTIPNFVDRTVCRARPTTRKRPPKRDDEGTEQPFTPPTDWMPTGKICVRRHDSSQQESTSWTLAPPFRGKTAKTTWCQIPQTRTWH